MERSSPIELTTLIPPHAHYLAMVGSHDRQPSVITGNIGQAEAPETPPRRYGPKHPSRWHGNLQQGRPIEIEASKSLFRCCLMRHAIRERWERNPPWIPLPVSVSHPLIRAHTLRDSPARGWEAMTSPE